MIWAAAKGVISRPLAFDSCLGGTDETERNGGVVRWMNGMAWHGYGYMIPPFGAGYGSMASNSVFYIYL